MTRLPALGIPAALATLAVLPIGAAAQTQVVDFTGGTIRDSPPPSDAISGWRFNLSSTVNLTDLGVFDVGNDGLANSHQVGLWRFSDKALLASTTIAAGTSASAVVSSSGFGSFRYNDITGLNIVLTPGEYVIGAAYAINKALNKHSC